MENKNRKKGNASKSGEDSTSDSNNPQGEAEPPNDSSPGEVAADDSEETNDCPHVRKYKQPETGNSKGKKRVSTVKSIKCLTCVSEQTAVIESEDLWFCMQCYETRCGRYSQEHGLKHFECNQDHCLSLSVVQWRIWCYHCDKFITPQLIRGKLESSMCLAKKAFKKTTVTYKDFEVIENPIEEIVTRKICVVGLQNLGNTCYFNSTLQNLLYLSTFKRELNHTLTRTEFRLVPKKHSELPPITFRYTNKNATTPGALTNALSLLIEHTQTNKVPAPSSSKRVNLKRRVCCPREVQQAISKRHKKFSNGSQQDSHELLRFLIDLIKDEEIKRLKVAFLDHFGAAEHKKEFKTYSEEKKDLLKNYASEFKNIFVFTGTFIDDVFGGKMLSIVRCHTCSDIFSINEDFLDLSLSLPVEKYSSSPKKQAKPLSNKKQKQKTKAMEKAAKKEEKKAKTKPKRSQADENQLAFDLTEVNSKPKEDNKAVEKAVQDENTEGKTQPEKSQADENQLACDLTEVNSKPKEDNKAMEKAVQDENTEGKTQPEKSQADENQLACDLTEVNSKPEEDNKVTEEKDTATPDESQEKMESNGEPGNHLDNAVNGLNLHTQDTLDKAAPDKDEDDVDTTPAEVLDKEIIPETESNESDQQKNDLEIPDTNSVSNEIPDSNMEVEQASSESVPSKGDTADIVKPKDILRLTYPNAPPRDSLQHFITRFFSAEILEGDYLCTHCNPQLLPSPEDEKTGGDDGEATDEKESSQESIDLSKCKFGDATKQFHITHLPPILTIHLKRFSQIGARLQKINKQIDFPLVLDMSPYCTADIPVAKDNENSILYGLRGIVNHSGGMAAGHYIAYVNIADWGSQPTPDTANIDPSNSGECPMEISLEASEPSTTTTSQITHPQDPHGYSTHVKPTEDWYYISDSHVSRVSSDDVFNTQAYILFYERLPLIISK